MTRVGVALPVRNGLRWIETCLTSLRQQTVPVAVYIVDDASTDATADFLTKRPSWYRALIRLPIHVGWPAAANRAAEEATGDDCDAILTMNADDWLDSSAIAHLHRALTWADWAVPWVQQIGGDDVVEVSAERVDAERVKAGVGVRHCPMVGIGLWRTDVWHDLGGFDPAVNDPEVKAGHNEWDLYLRAAQEGYAGVTVPRVLAYHRVHPAQLHHDVVTSIRARKAFYARHGPDPNTPVPPGRDGRGAQA